MPRRTKQHTALIAAHIMPCDEALRAKIWQARAVNHTERRNARKRQQLAASIAAYITQCDDALRAEMQRCKGAWPDRLTLPLWPAKTERIALVHWMDELASNSGKKIRIDFARAAQ